MLTALSFAPRPGLVLYVGADVGLIQRSRNVSVFCGLTVLVVDLWDTARERRRRVQAL